MTYFIGLLILSCYYYFPLETLANVSYYFFTDKLSSRKYLSKTRFNICSDFISPYGATASG